MASDDSDGDSGAILSDQSSAIFMDGGEDSSDGGSIITSGESMHEALEAVDTETTESDGTISSNASMSAASDEGPPLCTKAAFKQAQRQKPWNSDDKMALVGLVGAE
eukprot:4480906-Lingulodinium_polyedra.AAC.1